jgi:ubiquinone/menaquinone biosynthesis C-methylase UbiE
MSMPEHLKDTSESSASMTLRQMLGGCWLTQSIHVIAKLGIADLLKDGPQTAEQLSGALRVNADALYRMLRTLTGYELFEEDEQHRFGLLPMGALLQKGVHGSLHALAIWNGEVPYKAWGAVMHTMTTGQPALRHALGMKLFEYLTEDREAGQVFDEAMTGLSIQVSRAVVAAYDFSGIKRIVDVGGGQGTLIAAVLQANPSMQGVLFDRSPVVEGAKRELQASGIADRCEIVAGDFFEFAPEGGDAYLLSSIIHDWDDARGLLILQNCRRAMERQSKLLLVECVIPDAPGPVFSKLLDLQMLVVTGGRERTESQFKALLAVANFNLNKIIPTEVPECIIEAVAV